MTSSIWLGNESSDSCFCLIFWHMSVCYRLSGNCRIVTNNNCRKGIRFCQLVLTGIWDVGVTLKYISELFCNLSEFSQYCKTQYIRWSSSWFSLSFCRRTAIMWFSRVLFFIILLGFLCLTLAQGNDAVVLLYSVMLLLYSTAMS